MERNGKHIAKEATNGIIYDSAGQIVHNGLLEICPFCGEMNNHFGSGGSVNISKKFADELEELSYQCRHFLNTRSAFTTPAAEDEEEPDENQTTTFDAEAAEDTE